MNDIKVGDKVHLYTEHDGVEWNLDGTVTHINGPYATIKIPHWKNTVGCLLSDLTLVTSS